MLSTLLLASATLLPTDHQAFLETLESANAANQRAVTVCVNPPAHLYADAGEEAFDTPLGKVEKIADDIAIIKTAVDTGKTIKDATVDVAVTDTPKSWTQWLYLIGGVVIAFILKLIMGLCGRFKEVFVAANKILQKAEEGDRKAE